MQGTPGEGESYNHQYSTSVKRFQYIELMPEGIQNVVGFGRIRNEEERLFAIPIGKKMGVSSSVITELKKGNIKKPSFELMCKITDALEVSLDVFRKEGSTCR